MKASHISDALNLLNDDIIQQTDVLRQRKRKRGRGWWKWAGAAACFIIVSGAGTGLFLHMPERQGDVPQSGDVPQAGDLPMLTIFEDTGAGMGFEGYMAYDVSELVNANPWREDMELTTLPVYNNPLSYDENFIAAGADFQEMRGFLLDIAGRLGLKTETLNITDDAPDQEMQYRIAKKFQDAGESVPEGYFQPTRVMAEEEGVEIQVEQSMTAEISFEPAVSLPDRLNFTFYASFDEISAAAEYLKTEYRDLIKMQNPQIDISGGDYNIYLQQHYSLAFFDAVGSDVEQIINYNFNRIIFYGSTEGKLDLVRIFRPDLSQKIGDYPIITSKEAEGLLSKGNYITSVPYEMPGTEYVKGVELVYRTGETEKCYMPYYHFYVELPEEEQENGLKTYGGYYVPAVQGEYISNMPVWDGGFN